jgi:hypothetical protein
MPEVSLINNNAAAKQVPNPVIAAFQILFGRSARHMATLKGQQVGQEKYASFDSIESRLNKVFTGYSDIQYDRQSKYRDYDRMDSASTEAQTGLDIYAEEASQKDDKTGLRVWVESQDKKMEDDLNGMLQRVRMEFKAYGLYRNLAKYGDCFMYMLLGGYGVHDFQFIHPIRVERVQEDGLLGFRSPEIASHMPTDNRTGMFKPWDFLHLRITAFDQESVYGRSFLENIRKTWKQLSMLETMIVLYRISKAVQRNIFYVDVGQASIQETKDLVKDYEKFLKNKQSYVDPKTNDFKLDFNPATMLQDIVWPVRPGSLSKVEQLQSTTNIGPMDDLEHFYRKIRIGLNIPKEYFDGEQNGAWSSKESLMLQDIRFGRKITKLQDGLREGVVRLCQIHWAIKYQAYLDPTVFIVQLGTVSAQAERQREDVLLRKAQILEILANIAVTMGWNRWAWGDYLLDEIFPLPAKLRSKLQTPDPVIEMEAERAEKMAASAGPGGGKGGIKKAAKPPKKVTADNLRMGLRGFGAPNTSLKVEDVLSNNEELMEEFKTIGEEIIDGQAPVEKLYSFFEKISYRDGDLVIQQINAFSPNEIAALISANPVPKTDSGSLVEGVSNKPKSWAKFHEMGIPPGAFVKDMGYEDPLDPSEDFTPDF